MHRATPHRTLAHLLPEPAAAPGPTLLELQLRLERCETRLRGLAASLAEEVRTRRLVVVEEDGFERIVLAAWGDGGEAAVRTRGPGPAPSAPTTTAVALSALDGAEARHEQVAASLTSHGDVVAALELADPRAPALWFDDPSPGPGGGEGVGASR